MKRFHWCDVSSTEERYSSLTDRIKAYMEQNFAKPITLAETAE